MKCACCSWIRIVSVLSVLLCSLAIETPLEWDTGRSQSVFASILKTLSSSNVSPNCPGRCFNALAAMVCTKVLDKPGMCPQGYRCCQNLPSKDNVSTVTEMITTELENTTNTIVTLDDRDTLLPTSSLQTTTIPTDTRDAQKNKNDPQRLNEEQVIEKVDSDSTLLQYTPKTRIRVCRGVCVVKRISSFCEAAIDIDGLCKTDLRCCVPANLFDGVDDVPKEFVILNPALGNKTKSQPDNALPNLSSTTSPSLTTSPGRATSKTSRITTLPPKTTGGTTSSPREQGMRPPELSSQTTSIEDDNSSIPPERRCKGTCVAGFFAFLCDSIDRSGECPHERRCCVTDKRTKPKPRPRPQGEKGIPRRTTSRPKRVTTASSSTLPPTTSTEPPPPPCPGTCLPVTVASRCQAPSRLVVASGCREDEICCDDAAKRPESKHPLQSKPDNQVPQALGTLLSLFGGGSQKKKRPSRPTRPTTTTTTTPATTTMAVPECPGTCIAPILSFTCFGNAEISDLFKCNKDKQTCCAPKSAIRKQNLRNQMNNIARNDTIYPHQFQSPGHYGQPQYEPQLYHKQNYIPTHYHQQLEGGHFHHPIYNHQKHLQPPPLPSPPHLRDSENNQLPPVRPLQSPPQFEAPSFEKPLHEEKHTFPSYHQPAPDSSDRPLVQHNNHYSFNNPPPFYQPGPTYERNYSTNYPHSSTITTPSLPITTPAGIQGLENKIPVRNKYVCGVKGTNRAGRVVGGEDSLPGEWCWQVALINSLNQYLCGGALIGTQWVLTAAHCVTNIVRSGDAIYVRVGDHDLTTRYGSPGAQTIPVATTYIHHNHNSQTLDNDIALLKLSTHAELGQGVCLVCLPARGVSQVAGKRCTVTGYGYMGETGPIPLRIRKAEIPVVSDNECVRQINAVTEKIFILPASSFCAGGESGHDACQGDGGGPLVCNVDNYFELSGLVSWGFGCGRKDVPGVYVKVSSFIGWINQIISVNNS